ncbi:hypothetical protein LTR62_002228 [Meristemomyces frigidus]|uniref:CHCH domain-containing protein n=1 Tax=Meristemomyces frigidus TaxID=1508187 RepID=A0AAN7TJP5_9PEZI|nr:hypothetical protein LTR62_002228 [Meristemomyces frigidus]
MPRQSRGPSGGAPRRPTAAPPTRAAAPLPSQPSQARQASTVARPAPQAQQQQQQQSAGPGMMGTMASSMAGAVVGSSIGHAIGGLFGGSSSQPEAAPLDSPSNTNMEQGQYGALNQSSGFAAEQSQVCGFEAGSFRKCMDENKGDMTICSWYLDQLKSCQSMSRQY